MNREILSGRSLWLLGCGAMGSQAQPQTDPAAPSLLPGAQRRRGGRICNPR